jgi:phospholipid/cholesterol/gamma-HCH transport system ATP-binding protein
MEMDKANANIEEKSQPKSRDDTVIEIKGLKKSFDGKIVLKGIDLELKKSENVVVLGRSGTGKSVTIECIVGLLKQDEGSLKVFGDEVAEMSDDELKQLRTKVGFLFQSGALYDSMTIRENLEFPLTRVLKLKNQREIDRRIEDVLESVDLLDAIDKLPSDLSGGMRKRAGLARTIVVHPKIMLYDEPTTGLDPITSREISELILTIQKKYKTSSLIITHDMECARMAADRLLIMEDGEFIAEGTFESLHKSNSKIVASFFRDVL